MSNIAVIPIRSGSKRLPKKNYLPFNYRNLVEIALEKCVSAGVFDKIIITSDDNYFSKYADGNSIFFLKRDLHLANDDASTDIVIDYLFEALPDCENLLWVNSVSPLQTVDDIIKCSDKLNETGVDGIMAVNTMYQHCILDGKPLNFDPQNAFEKTQDLEPVKRFVYSCMGWKRDAYVNSRKNGFKGLFPGNFNFVEVSYQAGMLIKFEEDFKIFEALERALGLHPKIDLPNDNFV